MFKTLTGRYEHAASGRLNLKSTENYPIVGYMGILQENVTYGEARGYEQFYIEEYDTCHGIIGQEISQENRKNKVNSYNTKRTDDRAEYFNETYNKMNKEMTNNEEDAYGGQQACKKS